MNATLTLVITMLTATIFLVAMNVLAQMDTAEMVNNAQVFKTFFKCC